MAASSSAVPCTRGPLNQRRAESSHQLRTWTITALLLCSAPPCHRGPAERSRAPEVLSKVAVGLALSRLWGREPGQLASPGTGGDGDSRGWGRLRRPRPQPAPWSEVKGNLAIWKPGFDIR